ncbi:MAG TPA: hypothetical protein VH986_08400 [Acidimicrobiia bacterium]|jgi:hypothetical protein
MRLITRGPAAGTGPSPSSHDEALLRIDAALSLASRRQAFTGSDVVDLLRGVQRGIADEHAEVLVGRAIEAAAHTDGSMTLVDRARVIDQLLDLRLAIAV